MTKYVMLCYNQVCCWVAENGKMEINQRQGLKSHILMHYNMTIVKIVKSVKIKYVAMLAGQHQKSQKNQNIYNIMTY